MNKSEVIKTLEDNYSEFIQYVDQLTLDEYEFAPDGKWSAGQQVEHLIKSTSPLNMALGLPKWVLKLRVGKANRPSRSYNEVIAKYKLKLERGGKAGPKYTPAPAKSSKRTQHSKRLSDNIETLKLKVGKWSEEDLDNYILPHPLLGKVTVREMMYFTAYHAHHHQMLIKHYLKGV